jgi:hypothetical protein
VGNITTFLDAEEISMKTLNKFSGFGTALFVAVFSAAAYAEDGDTTQTRSQERTRTELNLQLPASDFGQSHHREEHTVMKQNQYQNQYQYKYMNRLQNKQSNAAASSMNRMNTANRNMQGSAATGSMYRQNTASRSAMSRGRR